MTVGARLTDTGPDRAPGEGESQTPPSLTRPPRRVAPRIFPLQPLLDAARLSVGQAQHTLRISGSMIRHAEASGLTLRQADIWAFRLGFLAEEIWPEQWMAQP